MIKIVIATLFDTRGSALEYLNTKNNCQVGNWRQWNIKYSCVLLRKVILNSKEDI